MRRRRTMGFVTSVQSAGLSQIARGVDEPELSVSRPIASFVRLESGVCVPDFDFDIDILPCPEGLIWVNGHCVPDFGLELIQPDFDFGLIQPDFDFDFDLTDRFPGL